MGDGNGVWLYPDFRDRNSRYCDWHLCEASKEIEQLAALNFVLTIRSVSRRSELRNSVIFFAKVTWLLADGNTTSIDVWKY